MTKKRAKKKAPKKSDRNSAKVIVEKAMPGWTVAGTGSKDAKPSASLARADAVSPSLGKMKAKASGKKDVKPVKFTALKKNHARFVRVKPANASDADGSQEKVVLLRDGKIVARQG
jgi:hypothetical protein